MQQCNSSKAAYMLPQGIVGFLVSRCRELQVSLKSCFGHPSKHSKMALTRSFVLNNMKLLKLMGNWMGVISITFLI